MYYCWRGFLTSPHYPIKFLIFIRSVMFIEDAALGIPRISPIARIICLEMPSRFASGRCPASDSPFLYRNLPDRALGNITNWSLCYKTLASLLSSAILTTHAKNWTHPNKIPNLTFFLNSAIILSLSGNSHYP